MHFDSASLTQTSPAVETGPWHQGLTRYHWFVLVVAALGWLFDTMDQQLFNLARKPAVMHLIHAAPSDPNIDKYAGYATTIFMIGWALGGLVFGILGDRIGRAKTMLLTILLYSAFTGLSALSMGFCDFAFYRFLTGLGVGGEFAVGVSLVAEVMPDRARPMALGWLQALSAVGNMLAAVHQHRAGQGGGIGRDRQRLAGDVRHRRAARPALAVHLQAGSRSPSSGRPPPPGARPTRRRAARPARTGSARSASCSATRGGGGTRSSACSWPSPGSSASGGSASSAST